MSPSQPTSLELASQAQQMARHADGRDAVLFQKVALISMGVLAFASAAHAVRELLRDINRKHDHHTNRHR